MERQKKSWFVAQIKPNQYKIAERNLTRQGIETYLPIVATTKRKGKAFITQNTPLFPGYIFVSFCSKELSWMKINNTLGVNKLVSAANQPQPLPEEFIFCLKKRYNNKGIKISKLTVSKGEMVKIVKGPFASFIGTIESIDPEKRIAILFDFMGQKTRTYLKEHYLHQVNKHV